VSPKAARLLLWVVMLLLVPVPYWGLETERAPVVRLLLLATLTGAVAMTEGGFDAVFLASVFALQALLATGALLVLAWSIVRVVPAARRGAVVAALVALLCAAAWLHIYRTPFARHGPTTNVLGILG
jgi:hypothetical protein